MKDNGTQTKCSLCKQPYKVFGDPTKHTDRLFCEECAERVQELTDSITLHNPATSVEIWSGATMVVSFTGGATQDQMIPWRGSYVNIPFRPWVIIGKFPLRDYTDAEVADAVWYWMVEMVDLREAWDLTLGRLRKEEAALNEKIQSLGEGDEFGQVDERLYALREDLAVVERKIKAGKAFQSACPKPGEDTVLFRRLVDLNRQTFSLKLPEGYTEEQEAHFEAEQERLSTESAAIITQRFELEKSEWARQDELVEKARALLEKTDGH